MPTTKSRKPSVKAGKEMGRVTTEVLIENFDDLWAVRRKLLIVDDVRRIVIPDALVDTGATGLSLPKKVIRKLGLVKIGTRPVRTTAGVRIAATYNPVNLTIQGRTCVLDVIEVPDDVPVLIGQVPLELLDFVVDLRRRKLIGNPAHGGEHMYEQY